MRAGTVTPRLVRDRWVQLVLVRTVVALQHLAISLCPVEDQRLDYPVCSAAGPDTPDPR
ncbi:hypothetical protein ACWF82_02360 [Nocardia sp. NPDC055053]